LEKALFSFGLFSKQVSKFAKSAITRTNRSNVRTNLLKGHGNEADFLGFFQKLVPHRSLTLPFEPFRFWFRIRGDIRNRKTTPDSESRLLNVKKETRRVGESSTPRFGESSIRRVVDSPTRLLDSLSPLPQASVTPKRERGVHSTLYTPQSSNVYANLPPPKMRRNLTFSLVLCGKNRETLCKIHLF
jgi:hypothetical protein